MGSSTGRAGAFEASGWRFESSPINFYQSKQGDEYDGR